jgi:hypothetical protein
VTTAVPTTYRPGIDIRTGVDDPAVNRRRPPGALRRAWNDIWGLLGLTLRLIWRHWPVLLSLALAGTLAREWALTGAVKATAGGGTVGWVVFLFVPLCLLIAMALMLRTVRPSLPNIGRTRAESMVPHVSAVLVPFLVFYLNAGMLQYDVVRFNYSILGIEWASAGDEKYRYVQAGVGLALLAGIAFAVRWLLNRFDVVRRRPLLGLPAAYFEIVWVASLILLTYQFWVTVRQWRDERVVWQAGLEIWRSDFAPLGPAAGVLRELRDFLTTVWATADGVLIVPVAALISGGVVLAVNTAALNQTAPTRSRFLRLLRIGGYAGRSYGRFANLGRLLATLRLVFRSGVVFTMVYCLMFVAAFTIDEWLQVAARSLIGPQSVSRFWEPIEFPLSWFTQALGLVVVMCLVAAAVDRSPLGRVDPEAVTSRHEPDVAR